jgi:phosphate transport system substrate-binding protein
VRRQHYAALATIAGFLVACSGGGGDTKGAVDSSSAAKTTASGGADLTGAGSTFAQPLYVRWAASYDSASHVKINYQPIGSGGGIKQLSEMTVDFGGTDGPMSDAELAGAKGGTILHIPTALGAVVVSYNLPELKEPLKLTGAVIADIFLGKLGKWNDARIATLNPGVTLPAKDILVVHRTDGSGTTYVFTDYLTAVSPSWKAGPGKGKDVKWPVGLGGKGNDGVSGQIKQTPAAIGYIELAYAKQNSLPFASVQNAAGKFVVPSVETVTAAAAAQTASLPATSDYRVSIVNASGADAYPISSFTWIIAYANQSNPDKAKKLTDFLKWGLTSGQAYEQALYYAPLPEALAKQLVARVDSIKVGSK